MKLTINICTVPSRVAQLSKLVSHINSQSLPVLQINYLGDNMVMSIGEKRNWLMAMSRGEYVCYVDDDDQVDNLFVKRILDGIRSGKDVICYGVKISLNGGPLRPVDYSIHNDHLNSINRYSRKPNHLMVWRRDLVKDVPFDDTSMGEDTIWATKVTALATSEHKINEHLYTYHADRSKSESVRRNIRDHRLRRED